MKEFAASVILFVVIVVGVIFNTLYIKDCSEELKSLALAVYRADGETNESKAIDELDIAWKKHKKLLAMSISLREIDTITEYVIRLECAKRDKDQLELGRVYHLLCNSIDDAVRYDRPSLHTVF